MSTLQHYQYIGLGKKFASNYCNIQVQTQVQQSIQLKYQAKDFSCKSGNVQERLKYAFRPPGPDTPNNVIECKKLDKLQVRDSPFSPHDNYGGGFVNELDKVALTSLFFAKESSIGSIGLEHYNPEEVRKFDIKKFDELKKQGVINLPPWVQRAGARKNICFNPSNVTAAIVTCGGLCPGLNDVVAGLSNKLQDYGVKEDNILGIRYGFQGFYNTHDKPIKLTKQKINQIQLEGGTILGTSRGGADLKKIASTLDVWGIDMLFVVGGNGGNAGANAIQEICETEQITCSVIGIPKSIDNDILLIDKTFGFESAVEEAQRALQAAKVEAQSALRGIGLVKLMGRQSGFIAMHASLASGMVDVCLIPETPFQVDKLIKYVGEVLDRQGHCVLCCAEGAGQELSNKDNMTTDASGNAILFDIGVYLRDMLKAHFGKNCDMKYIDPTYMIRAIPTVSQDRILCKILAHNAVHAAFAGFTGVTSSLLNTHYVLLPIPLVIAAPRTVDPHGKMWNRTKAAIGQPNFSDEDL